jgi:hypothetical protein
MFCRADNEEYPNARMPERRSAQTPEGPNGRQAEHPTPDHPNGRAPDSSRPDRPIACSSIELPAATLEHACVISRCIGFPSRWAMWGPSLAQRQSVELPVMFLRSTCCMRVVCGLSLSLGYRGPPPLWLAFGQASLCQVASDDSDTGLASDSGV